MYQVFETAMKFLASLPLPFHFLSYKIPPMPVHFSNNQRAPHSLQCRSNTIFPLSLAPTATAEVNLLHTHESVHLQCELP